MQIQQMMLATLPLVVAGCLPLCAQDVQGVVTNSELLQNASESNSVVELPEIASPEIGVYLRKDVAMLQDAMRDVDDFVARKGAEKQKKDFWRIEERVVADGKTVSRVVHFQSENGPVIYAYKSVRDGEDVSAREIADQSYKLEFYPNGRVERFLMRGSMRTEIRFYPSGEMSEYYVISGKVAVISGRWEEDGKVK
jgi:hypothetical protein